VISTEAISVKIVKETPGSKTPAVVCNAGGGVDGSAGGKTRKITGGAGSATLGKKVTQKKDKESGITTNQQRRRGKRNGCAKTRKQKGLPHAKIRRGGKARTRKGETKRAGGSW